MERSRIELPGGKVACSGKFFAVGFFFQVKRAHVRALVDRSAVGRKLLILRVVSQSGVRLEETVDEFAFLLLGAGRGETNEQYTRGQKLPHTWEAAEVGALL